MSRVNNKDLTEVLDIIKSDADSIDIPEGIKPENMMKRIEEKKTEGYFEESNKVIGTNDKRKKRNKRALLAGGIASAITAASLGIIIAGAGLRNNNDRMVFEDFYSSVKDQTESEEAIPTLDNYSDLRQLLIVKNTMREKENLLDYLGDMFGSVPKYEATDDLMNDMPEGSYSDGAFSEDDRYMGTGDNESLKPEASEPEHSDTNSRTENVAEADIIKTDGRYIYALTCGEKYGEVVLSIFSAKGDNSQLLCNISLQKELESTVKSQQNNQKDNEKAIVYDSVFYCEQKELMIYKDKLVILCSYDGYTVALFTDVTDRAEPKITDKLYIEGSYDSCRLTGGYLYLFAEKNLHNWRYINYKDDIYTEEKAQDILAPDTSNGKLNPSEVYVTECEEYNTYHMIATVDMENTTEFKQVRAILGEQGCGQIYVSADHIYYITDMYNDIDTYMKQNEASEGEEIELSNKSEIISLTYGDGLITPVKRGEIEGSVGDEFAIDEYNGYLRVAVSTSSYTVKCVKREMEYYNGSKWVTDTIWAPSYIYTNNKNGSALYVLDENLQVVGSIPQLKENESVYGVRFDGNIAYVVTYEQKDPLFSIDLSDPTNPVVLGALKIPGFSTYLHKWDENTLIGIGYNEWGEIKISTFDISDKTDVKETDVCDIEGVYWASALYNHKAVFISPEKNLIGFMDDYGRYRIFSYIDGELTEVIVQQLVADMYYEARGMYINECIYIVGQENGLYIYDINTYEFIKSVELP